MISSTDIDIEHTHTTAIISTSIELSRIQSLFIYSNKTYIDTWRDRAFNEILPDGSINTRNKPNKLVVDILVGRQQHNRETVVNVSKCGELLVKFIKGKLYEAHIYNLNQGRTYSFPCNDFMSRFPPKATSVGQQLVIAGDTKLHVMTKGGTLIRVVPIDSPCLWKEGQREEKEVKDICGYDQFSALVLFSDAIHQVDIQTGTCKLLAHASAYTHSLKCNGKYIFAGMPRQKCCAGSYDGRYDTINNYGMVPERILVLDRVNGK